MPAEWHANATSRSSFAESACSRMLEVPMALDRFAIEGFRSIEKVELELSPLNVLIGANGSGKTNLLSAFSLLGAIVEHRLQATVAKRGGASALLHHGPQRTREIRLRLDFGQNGYEANLDSRLVTTCSSRTKRAGSMARDTPAPTT